MKAKKPGKVIVVQTLDNRVPAKIIAESIRRIGEGVRAMDHSGLSEKAVVILLSHASSQTQAVVRSVLWGLRNLEKEYLK